MYGEDALSESVFQKWFGEFLCGELDITEAHAKKIRED